MRVFFRPPTGQRVGFGFVGPSHRFSFLSISKPKMNNLFDKKFKKSSKYSQQAVFLGIPTNIAAGPLGFRADLDIGPKGEQYRPRQILQQI